MVACSWLLSTALRGAATGVGSLGIVLVVVVITGFSGSMLGLTLGVGGLAGFHIEYILSSQVLDLPQRSSRLLPPALIAFETLGDSRINGTLVTKLPGGPRNSGTAELALPSQFAGRKCRPYKLRSCM